MKKQEVSLKKLWKLKILQIVEPTENLKNAYLQKAEDSLNSSKILLENKQYSDSLALSYFSMYNSVLALLYLVGVKSENHNASIFLLKQIFGIDNESLKKAKSERRDSQYYPNTLISKKDVLESIKITELFNTEILDFINKINTEDKEGYLKKLKNILS
jgi:uncharacterized protein (UPF0332 family)